MNVDVILVLNLKVVGRIIKDLVLKYTDSSVPIHIFLCQNLKQE